MKGSRGRGRGRGGGVLSKLVSEHVSTEEDQPVKKRRGRPPAASSEAASSFTSRSGVSRTVMLALARNLPKDDRDGESVKCAECGVEGSYREFRLHNIQQHSNVAVTVEEKADMVLDHKYFSRKLNEFRKLTKMTMFTCSREKCSAPERTFKSTLGLAHHMNTCGRPQDEIEAVLLECEVCHQKFTFTSMQWHRKTHLERDDDERVKTIQSANSSKRRSAVRARKSFRQLDDDNEDGKKGREGDDDDENEDFNVEALVGPPVVLGEKEDTMRSSDYSNIAIKFLDVVEHEAKAWDDPSRNCNDPFLPMKDNKFYDPQDVSVELNDYLPIHIESVEFKYISNEGSSNYHRLMWFEGETLISNSPQTAASVHHAGGPVLSMSWHPSGKLLAVSVGKDYYEEIDLLKTQTRKSCIHIYSRSANSLNLQLVVGVEWGYCTHIQWSSFCPDIMDSYNPSVKSCFDDVEIFCRIGYLAMNCEDSTVRIMAVRIEDLKLDPNYEYKPGRKVNVYTKTPEIWLKLDDSAVDDDLGNAVKFDWHEKNRFLAVGYSNGLIALYDLETTSSLLVHSIVVDNNDVTVINPFWTLHGHRSAIRGIRFDPMNPRYLVTASHDRTMKVWDVHTRMERDTKRVGLALDLCWIRGWMHQAASFETHNAYQSSSNNYTRVFQIGSANGKPTCGENFNATSLDFYHGLTVQGTDDGEVSVTYYDVFWRECDFERNRKKKNLVHLCTTHVDKNSYTDLSAEDFTVTLKQLSKEVMSTKTYRNEIDEEEGAYAIGLEAKFSGSGIEIYGKLPNPEDLSDSEEEMDAEEGENERERKLSMVDMKVNVDNIFDDAKSTLVKNENKSLKEEDDNDQNSVFMEAINAIHQPKIKDGLLPVYDVNIRKEVPRIILSFAKQRAATSVPAETVDLDKFEEFIRFQPFIRINKVAWSPNGDVIAVGYRNGLISILPGSFESIYGS